MKKTLLLSWFLCLVAGLSASGQYRRNYLELGQIELMRENYVEAINYFSHYIRNYPNLHKAYFLRGLAKYNLDDLQGAEYDLSSAITRLPEYPRLYLVRGVIRAESLKLPGAMKDFNLAIELDSLMTDAYFYRSLAHLNLRDYESSLADANLVVAQDSTYPNIYILRGAIQAELQNYWEAIADFNLSVERNPENGRAYVERGTAYARLTISDLAMADFDAALALDSLDAYAYFQRGLVKMSILDYEGALVDLNRVIELSPENELAYFNRALLKSGSRAEGEAIQDFIHILNQNPDNMLVFYNLGLSFFNVGQYEAAIRSFSSAIQLYPGYADAYYQRSLAKKELGLTESSIQDMSRYESLLKDQQTKDDSTKYQEGLEILRLTHFSNEFIKEEEKKSKLQYRDIKIGLQPLFRVVIDSAFILKQTSYYHNHTVDYRLASIPFYAQQKPMDSLLIQEQLFVLNNQLKGDSSNMNLWLKRGLLLASQNKNRSAYNDLNTALTYDPRNVLVLFSRANVQIALLDSLLTHHLYTNRPAEEYRTEAVRLFSDISHDLNKILAIKPDFLYASYNRAYSRFLMEDYDGALVEFALIARQHKIAEAHFNKALLQLLLGNKEEACNELGTAGELGLEAAYPVIRKYCK